jgi:hypothetical protein
MKRSGWTMVAVTAVLGGLLAFWFLRQPSAQERLIADIKARGGNVETEGSEPDSPIIAVDLSFTRATDASLERIRELTTIRRLDLDRSKVSDSALVNLKGWKDLRELDLSQTGITNDGLEHLKELTGLQTLDLSDTAITVDGLKHLKGLTKLDRLGLPKAMRAKTAVKEIQGEFRNPKLIIKFGNGSIQ